MSVSHAAPRRSRGAVRATLGVFGELLITIGVVLLLSVVWELWWTTFKVEGGMADRIHEFQMEYPSNDAVSEIRNTDDPPNPGDVPLGEVFGVLHVPKWNWMEIPIVQGTGPEELDLGNAGHYVETQMPGQLGNSALAGHRRTYGNNFRRVDIMEPGDPIVVEIDQAYIVFEVTDHEIVWPHESEVVLPVPRQPGAEPTKRLLTLTTCHPEFGNSQRFILYSEMVYWTPKDSGIPPVLHKEKSD